MRHSKSSAFRIPWHVYLLAILLLGGAAFFLIDSGDHPFRTSSELDGAAYATSAETLRGNTYKFEGTVDNILDWSPSQGRLVSIHLAREDRLIPLVVTKNFNSINIQKGQKYLFLVEVGDKGILLTKQFKKP